MIRTVPNHLAEVREAKISENSKEVETDVV